MSRFLDEIYQRYFIGNPMWYLWIYSYCLYRSYHLFAKNIVIVVLSSVGTNLNVSLSPVSISSYRVFGGKKSKLKIHTCVKQNRYIIPTNKVDIEKNHFFCFFVCVAIEENLI